MYNIPAIKEAADILLVAEDIGIPMEHKNGRWLILCPNHEDHHFGSCYLDTKNNRYKCFACGAGGDVLELVSAHEGVSFHDACRIVAEICGGIKQFELNGNDGETGAEREAVRHIIPKSDQEFIGIQNAPVYTDIAFYEDIGDAEDDEQQHAEAVYDSDGGLLGYTVKKRVTANPLRDLYQSDPDTYHELIDAFCLQRIGRMRQLISLFADPSAASPELRPALQIITGSITQNDITLAMTSLIKRAQEISVRYGNGAAVENGLYGDMERVVAMANNIWSQDENAPF